MPKFDIRKVAAEKLGVMDPAMIHIPTMAALDRLLADGKPKWIIGLLNQAYTLETGATEAHVVNSWAERLVQKTADGQYRVWVVDSRMGIWRLQIFRDQADFMHNVKNIVSDFIGGGPRSVCYWDSKRAVPTIKPREVAVIQTAEIKKTHSKKQSYNMELVNGEWVPVKEMTFDELEAEMAARMRTGGTHGVGWQPEGELTDEEQKLLAEQAKAGKNKPAVKYKPLVDLPPELNPLKMTKLRQRNLHSQYGSVIMARVHDSDKGKYSVWADDSNSLYSEGPFREKYGYPAKYDMRFYSSYGSALDDYLTRKPVLRIPYAPEGD